MLPGSLAGFAAGIMLGAVNYGLLRFTAARASRAQSRAASAALLLGGYALRYSMILGLILLLIRQYNLHVALACLLGMLLATLGMAVCARPRKTVSADPPPADLARRHSPD